MALYRATGIVLRTYKVAEADRIAVVFSVEHGKIRTLVKGVRKTTARHGLRLEPLGHVALQLYRGRELDTVTQVQSLDTFSAIRGDLDRLARAAVMVEAVDASTLDREPDDRRYHLLLGALRSLEAHNRPLVVAGMLIRLLAADGVVPLVDRCTGCGRPDELVSVDLEAGGARCRACRSGMSMPERGFELLGLMLGGRMGQALNEPASVATEAIERVALTATERHLERRLRSASVHL